MNDETKGHCISEKECEENGYVDVKESRCVSQCPSGKFVSADGRSCVDKCEYGFRDTECSQCAGEQETGLTMHLDGTCSVDSCGTNENNNSFVCQCKGQYYANDGKCVYFLFCGKDMIASNREKDKGECIPRDECELFDMLEMHCLNSCEDDYYIKDKKCVYYSDCGEDWIASDADDDTKGKCIPTEECEGVVDEGEARCVTSCGDDQYVEEEEEYDMCVSMSFCNGVKDEREGETKGHCISEKECEENGYVDVKESRCVSQCPSTKFIDEDKKSCVETCQYGFDKDKCGRCAGEAQVSPVFMHIDGTCSEYGCGEHEVNNSFVCQCEEDYYIKDGKCVYYSNCGEG